MQKNKSHQRATLECYLFCFASFLFICGTAVVFGQLSGADWFGLFKQLYDAF